MPKRNSFLPLALLWLFLAGPASGGAGSTALAEERARVSGVVLDGHGGVVGKAEVSLLNAQQMPLGTARTDAQGSFAFRDVPPGSYLLVVKARGFAERRVAYRVRPGESKPVEVTLSVEPIHEQVTITANPGSVEDTLAVSQPVNVIGQAEIQQRAQAVVAQVATEEPGLHLQRTSPTIAGIYVRGLAGNKVNVFLDGVRFSTSAARGGINTFLDLIEPTSLETVEVLRGPSSAQYGSDAIGGSVQFLSRTPAFSSDRPSLHGTFGTSFETADASFGTHLTGSYAARNFGILVNLASRRVNTLRPGHGVDSHAAVTRFLGLRSDVLGSERLPDTAFTQLGGVVKLNWAPTASSNLITQYSRNQQDGGKRHDQLLGGDGNLVADLRNLMLDLFYVRYDLLRLRWLDSVSLTYSFNSQREERVNQGGNGNPRAAISHEYERTRAHGLQASASRLWGKGHTLLMGAEYYQEQIRSPSFALNPVTQVITLRRSRVPDRAGYRSGGIYVQNIFEVVPQKLRLVGNVRYSAASYRARAEDSPLVGGQRLWPDDSLRDSGLTYRAGVVTTPLAGLSVSANFSRGFRVPHMTDLGTLGLTGSGFEVAAPDVTGLAATIGSTASSDALSTGRTVAQLTPESSQSYEVGARYRSRRIEASFTFFLNDILDAITKQALILPPGAVGLQLGGQTITAQTPNGVVFVAASTNPVLVRANFDEARIHGFEHDFQLRLSPAWTLRGVFTYLYARDKRTGLPPNIEGGTPAPDGYLKIRYAPPRGRFWVEPYVHAAGRQERLSSLDLEDRRTGAMRSRASIGSFFLNGATARGLVGAGSDGLSGTADDVLLATRETLGQVQDRVLGPGVDSAPLFRAVPGFLIFNVRGGCRIGERHEVLFILENVSDRNYRGISWGLDAPGRSLSLRYTTRF